MFENNPDFDFGDDFSFDFATPKKTVQSKRALETPTPSSSRKKPKTVPIPKTVIKRKFPGPAGLLPDPKNLNPALLNNPDAKNNEDIPCSQTSLCAFQSAPWLEMSREHEAQIEQFDIKWIKTNASLNKLHNQKAPFLGAVIKSIECFEGKNAIVKVVLKDASGEIQGTVIHSLYEQYSDSLVAGSVIVLRQCSVLTTVSNNNHYLTITANNLGAIYWKKSDNEMAVIKVQRVPCDQMEASSSSRAQNRVGEVIGKENINSGNTVKRKDEVKASQQEMEAWQDAFKGIDMDSLFEDF